MRRVFLVLTILGALAPVVVTIVFISDHGVDFGEMMDQVTASEMALLLLLDLTISSVTFWVWISTDAPRHGIDPWWPFVAANLLVGLCCALPLYLYLRSGAREGQLETFN